MRTLKKGHKGNDVRLLQYVLGIDADGVFGPNTDSRLRQEQEALDLKPDGKCGPLTQKALGIGDIIYIVCEPEKVRFLGAPYGADNKPLKPLKEWAKESPEARYILNLAFFNSSGKGRDQYGVIKGRTLTYVRGDGRDIGYGGTDVRIYPNAENSCAGYKVAVANGVKQKVSLVEKRARNANGILKDGSYIHVQSVMPCTESALVSAVMERFDVKTLLIQDGGGSVGFYDAKKGVLLAAEKEGTNGRPVATAVAIVE